MAATFQEALNRIGVPLPTDLSAAELARIDERILEASLFSAKTNNEVYLKRLDEQLRDILDGKLDLATARLALRRELQRLGYEPDPEKRGTIQDLSSDRRINLVLETNQQMAQGYGNWRQGQDPAVLDQWPAQELFRAINSKNKRKDPTWQERFRMAGRASGQSKGWTIQDGRMVALKNHPLWEKLGTLFKDGLGNPYPPFAFGSGMDVRDVNRKTAIELGLLKAKEKVKPQERPFALNNRAAAMLGILFLSQRARRT